MFHTKQFSWFMGNDKHLKGIRGIVLALCMLSLLFGPYAEAQKCIEGNCKNGFGEMDSGDSFYVGEFKAGKWDGPGMRYNKESGAIAMSNYLAGEPTISIVEFHSGSLEFGYRKKNESDGKLYLHNGFYFREDGLFKFVDGNRSKLEFDFETSKCLIGDCENGFGAEYLIDVDIKDDTAAYLFVGYYSNGSWDGEGGYYEFGSGDFFVGRFLDNTEWNGALINHMDGIASFMEEGRETKILSFAIPVSPPWQEGQPKQPALNPEFKKGSYWRGLGNFAEESVGEEVTRTGPRTEFAITNKTLRKADKLSISTNANLAWSDDLLGYDLMENGKMIKLSVPPGYERSCTINVQIVFTDGSTSNWSNLDICKYHRFELTQNGKFQSSVD